MIPLTGGVPQSLLDEGAKKRESEEQAELESQRNEPVRGVGYRKGERYESGDRWGAAKGKEQDGGGNDNAGDGRAEEKAETKVKEEEKQKEKDGKSAGTAPSQQPWMDGAGEGMKDV